VLGQASWNGIAEFWDKDSIFSLETEKHLSGASFELRQVAASPQQLP
jgi:hypothetical protein